ncbi:MAG: hypothetical protein A2Z20_08625 [Bdellovibrionales bacterium RBG_16_40_8]|nr:MAG: hypothetical protein A2Z20_08625 [Bdellovibrionales bacterium RBG_16_40_8]
MKGIIRYMVFSTLVSLAIMTYTKPQKQIAEIVKVIKALKASTMQRSNYQDESEKDNDLVDMTYDHNGVVNTDSTNRGSIASAISSINNTPAKAPNIEYEQNGARYVYIEGKYYPVSQDNIYNINGRKVFYVNKRRIPNKTSVDDAQEVANTSTIGRKTADAGQSIKSSDMGLPTSPSEMLEVIKRSQKNIKARDEMLKRIDEQ